MEYPIKNMIRLARFSFLMCVSVAFAACSHSTSLNGHLYDDANISLAMRDALWDDAARLALNEVIVADNSFIDSVTIPQDRTELHYRDLVSLYNVRDVAARDSIFQIVSDYSDRTPNTLILYSG